MKTKQNFEMKKNLSQTFLRLLMVLSVLPMAILNAWGGGGGGIGYTTYLKAEVGDADTGKGLVYAAESSSSPANTSYTKSKTTDGVTTGKKSTVAEHYAWAKPARGFVFNIWTFSGASAAYKTNNGGVADVIKTTSNGGNNPLTSTTGTATASWTTATSYVVTYKQPLGGEYTVKYNYLTIANNKFTTTTVKETLELSPTSGDKKPYGVTQDDHDYGYSYGADEVTLSTSADNFIGWYEGSTQKSTAKTYTYPITKTTDVSAKFRWATVATPAETSVSTNSKTEAKSASVVFDVTAEGTWAANGSNFEVETQNASGPGSFTVTGKSYSAGKLTVNINFTANVFDAGSSVEIKVTPDYGEGAVAVVKGSAVEVVDYEARALVNEEIVKTGTLAEVLAHANTLNSTPTIQLTQHSNGQEFITAASTLQIMKSMILDLNNQKLKATAIDKLLLVKGTNASDEVKLTITDNSFNAAGDIILSRAASATSIGLEIADANQVTFQKGKLTVANTTAAAQGVHVTGTANLLMKDGKIDVTASSDARGLYVETGYATIQGGQLSASAATKAYALYSAAATNIGTGVSLTATTTTSTDAAAIYVNGGTSALDGVILTATAATSNAFGANVVAGKLVLNGGFITSTGTTDVYGVNIAAGASASVQQQASITATTTTGANAYGIENLGALILANSTISATSAANYASAVDTKTSSVSTSIEGGTYTATSATGYAYGLHHQYGSLNVDGGSFIAESAGDYVYGVQANEDATINNATLISADATGSAKKAYGFDAATSGKTIKLINCTIKAQSATSEAYAIRSIANTTATDCTLESKTLAGANAWGLYAESGTNILNSINATIEAYTTGAYGVDYKAGKLTIDGGEYNVTARQAIATSAANSEVYGVKIANGLTEGSLSNASFTVKAPNGSFSQNAYGVYTGSGTVKSTNCSYDVSAATKAYGIWGDESSSLHLLNNIVVATTKTTSTAYGIYAKGSFTINGGVVTSDTKTHTSYPLYFASTAGGEVLDGKFKAKGTSGSATEIVAPMNKDATSANVQVKGGFFYDITNLRYYVPDGYDIYGVDLNTTEYSEGYYFRVSDHLPYENVCYVYVANNQGKNTGSGTGFPTLAEAFDYVRNHSGSNYNIMMTQPYTLPANNYVLPSNATLVVPYKGTQDYAIGEQPQRRGVDIEMIAENRLLTFASGVNLDVYGKIEVSAEQFVCPGSSTGYIQGPYGRIHLENGSTVTLNDGARIYAWGYITGSGEIRVKNGAVVCEDFQLHDMTSAGYLSSNWTKSANINTFKVFPVSQYYIQNIEAPTKYYYGSKLLAYTGITVSTYKNPLAIGPIKVIGVDDGTQEKNFFNITSDDDAAWVRKSYDPVTDRVLWETNSSAELGSMKIDVPGYGEMNSLDYILPVTNNMTLHVLSGALVITQSAKILPDAEIIVEKTATLQINAKDTRNVAMGLFLYDQAQWGNYAGGSATKPIKYSPSWTNGTCPRKTAVSNMKDAAIYVKGKIVVDGAIYTSAGGAAIYSDNTNAGTIEFNANAAGDKELYESNASGSYVASTSAMIDSYHHTFTSAKLRNGGKTGPDANMTVTKNVAEEGDTYAYTNIDGTGYKWTKLTTVDACVIADETDPSNPVYYAKPQGYVAITSATEDANHLFHSVVGTRLFIQQPMEAGCQWWEVTATATDGVYHCATNDTYYKYNTTFESWEEYTVEVTFYRNEEGTVEQKVLSVNYGAKPDASIVSNPSKAEDAAATYQFYGWKSSKTETEYAYTAELETVTEDMSYLPVFTSITKKYTVTFKDAKNGADAPVEVFYGTSPEYAATKASTAQYEYEFTGWKATNGAIYAVGEALPVVEGAGVSYTAQWTAHTRSYDITWKNGETIIEVDENQLYGTATSYDDLTPTKATTNSYVYTFSGWLSSLDGNTYATGSTPDVAGETTYSAQFDATARYLIKFVNYDGEELSSSYVNNGQTPSCAVVPRRDRDATFYYVFTGWKNSAGTFYAHNTALPAVSAKETYTAQYTAEDRMYTVTFKNVDNNMLQVEEVFGYGAIPTYAVVDQEDAEYTYFFAGWKDEDELIYGLGTALPEVTADATYTALFNQVAKRMTVSDVVAIPANTDYVVTELHIEHTGKLTVPASSSITATNFVLNATIYKPGIDGAAAPASGQVNGLENINITGKAYFDLTLNTDRRIWHAFGVPFEIGSLDEVRLIADGREVTLGRDYEIVYYSGATRAAQGPGAHCWEYLKHYSEAGQPVENLIPGHGYMIAFTSPVNKIRFTKADGADLVYGASVRTNLHSSAIESNKDWNAIATPALYHAALNAGVTYCQVHVPYEIGSDAYQVKTMADMTFTSGMAVYLQATANRAVVVAAATPASVAARRAPQAITDDATRFEVTISTPERTAPMDNLFVEMAEEKTDEYIAGKDLAKAGVTTKVAQMWIDRFDLKLCVNTVAPVDDAADFPLSIYAPANGEYTIANANANANADYTLYLTRDGEAIWNLTSSPYTLDLNKGTVSNYGLRLILQAPQTATGLDEALIDAQGETRKVLIDQKVFIIRGDKVYSIDGQIVK